MQKNITISMAKKIIKDGRTGKLKGFKSKAGKSFSAALVLENSKVELSFN